MGYCHGGIITETGLCYVSFFVLFFGWTVLTLYWLVKLFRLIGKQTEKEKGAKTVQKIFLVILWICLFLGNSLMQVAQIFGSDAEVEVQPNGVIEMKHETGWIRRSIIITSYRTVFPPNADTG